MSPVRGHVILNPEENDDYLYMSGGQSWLIKKEVWEKVKWDAEVLFYTMKNLDDYHKGMHNEDTNFALRCREAGFKISHNHGVSVYHNDSTYTSIGRLVRRRRVYPDQKWVKEFKFPEDVGVKFAQDLIQSGYEAEAADILRMYKFNNGFSAMNVLRELEGSLGGPLKDSEFLLDNPEYSSL
jgi:GT2 family glycosyltransferase